MNHLKKREATFKMFEEVRRVILDHHNIAVDDILKEVKEFTNSIKDKLLKLKNGVDDVDKIFDKVIFF